MSPRTTPIRLDLKKDEKLEIEWQDGHTSVFTIAFLRKNCPCATCKTQREEQAKHKTRLTVLAPGQTRPLAVLEAELVGNYALRLDWSDNHGSGIYSFQYLRDLCPENLIPEARRPHQA